MNLDLAIRWLIYRRRWSSLVRFIVMAIKIMLEMLGPGDVRTWRRDDRAWPAATVATGPSTLTLWRTVGVAIQVLHLCPIPRLLN